jgi:hypothetical protein
MELEAEVQKLKDLNEELVRKQVTFLQTLLLDMLNVLLQCILCKGMYNGKRLYRRLERKKIGLES